MKRSVLIAMLAGVVMAGVVSSEAAQKRYAARISVSGDLEKDGDSSKKKSSQSSTRTQSEDQYYDLEVTVANTGKNKGTFDLEWYFFKRKLNNKGDKGAPVLAERGKKRVALDGMKRETFPVGSGILSWRESKTTVNNTGNKNKNRNRNKKKKSSGPKHTVSGSVYGGYVILLRADGEIIAKYSPDRKMLTDEALSGLETATVSKGGGAANSTKKNKKRKKNK